ncbi:mannitol dehydrogenase family protein [Ancylobacter pratisalsi]|uniref:Mannitol dehydrogenase family protein n=1 Tax=Ancylobacter pratisalsi TaxID=1745854 RepID=A0A6P1YKE9_9HYPH|nr:mannitol dehydrogenase family protein [Ancylobacter pratisalsi]QIB33595.1 mannitol dehydrogenase family protein [Ancylobacter pratisalsi]
MSAPRLTDLSLLHGAALRPGYEPAAHGVGIVHIGAGAFHRAHQAAYTDAALAHAGGDWRIAGISLRSRDVAEALNLQHGLYTLLERGADGTTARVIGSIAHILADDPAATLEALCDPAVKLVTLTVTEKGYGIDRTARAPDRTHTAVAADLANPAAPSGVLGLLVAALSRRRKAGTAPFTVLCCDNLPENGALLRDGVVGFARLVAPALAVPDLAEWIGEHVAFPSCMVDRITPAATPDTRAEAERLTGCTDLGAIETEPFHQWVIEDHFPTGRPQWEAGGALFVPDVTPYERMKLTMLNGSHSMLAYAGFLAGHRYVREVMADPDLALLVRRHLAAAAAVLPALEGIDLGAYGEALAERFANPAIAHETYQIAMDGTEKLPQRLLHPAVSALKAGQPLRPFAFAVAAWMRYCLGESDGGASYALRDPREAEIRAVLTGHARDAGAISLALQALPGLFPEALRTSPLWRAEVEDALAGMIANGMAEAVVRERSR